MRMERMMPTTGIHESSTDATRAQNHQRGRPIISTQTHQL